MKKSTNIINSDSLTYDELSLLLMDKTDMVDCTMSIIDLCNECGGNNLIYDTKHGILVCESCGHICESCIYDHSVEKAKNGSMDNSRCCMPTNVMLPQSSLSNSITGKGCKRLRTLNNWGIMPYKERSLNKELVKISKICAEYAIVGCIVDDAKIFYKKMSEYRPTNTLSNCNTKKNNVGSLITRGRNQTGILAACVYYACKKHGNIKSTKEISNMFKIPSSKVAKGCKIFLKYAEDDDNGINVDYEDGDKYIKHVCKNFKLSDSQINEIQRIYEKTKELDILDDHTQSAVIVGCILFGCQEMDIQTVDIDKLATLTKTSEMTINKIHEVLMSNKKNIALFDDDKKEDECDKETLKILTKRKKEIEQLDTNKIILNDFLTNYKINYSIIEY